jgi:uncharacterized protein YggE
MIFGTTTVALALAMIAPPAMAQVPAAQPIADGTLLEVSSVGRITLTPDIATIRAGVVTQSPTAAAALGENAQRMARVVKALKAAGVADRDVTTSNVSLSPQYRYADNQPPAITGYQASNSVSVKFRDIARSGAVLDALVQSGANQIDGPSMSIASPDSALDAARGDAMKRARARAELYARAANLHVERIVSINEAGENDGGSPHPPVFMARMAAQQDSATTVMAGETDVSVTLQVRFLLK